MKYLKYLCNLTCKQPNIHDNKPQTINVIKSHSKQRIPLNIQKNQAPLKKVPLPKTIHNSLEIHWNTVIIKF